MLSILEDRCLLSTYVVTSGGDTNNTGTLRYGINQANAVGSTITEIDFNIGTSGSAQTINLTSQLPGLTANGVYINGLSQGGSGNATQLITLNGSGAGSGSDGLLLQGANCTVSGLIIEDFSGDGIYVEASGNQVLSNYIGTNTAGAANLGNSGSGIEIAGNSNTVGGSTSAYNVIAGNSSDGVLLDSTASGNAIQGDYIGIDTASTAVANGANGVEVKGVNNNIGGSVAAARDFISGNSNDGVLIDNGASLNQVQGDFIGTDSTGSVGVGNLGNGIEVAGSVNTIGNSASGATLNIISGNSKDGVLLDRTASDTSLIDNSYNGINLHLAALPNGANGIEVASDNNTIGGSILAARNYIAGNSNDGLLIDSSGSGNQVQGNFIGLAPGGTSGVANVKGIEIAGSNNTIGGTSSGFANAISGNSSDGVLIDSGATGNVILGDYVGTNYNGTSAVGNSGSGIEIAGSGNTIGGAATGASNVIAGNSSNGILIDSSGSGNRVLGNYIGTNSAGASTLGNSANGINIAGKNNAIGGSVAGSGDTIAYNSYGGVLVSVGTGNTIRQNSIYDNCSPANTGPGIQLSNGGNNDLGPPSISDTISGSTLTVNGTFTATTTGTFVLDFFANPSGDPEGKVFLGSKQVSVSSTGTQSFTFTDSSMPTGAGPLITATLTDPSGDTSGETAITSFYVLDLNTGETVPTNVPLNTFSTSSENLLARTEGVTGSSYSWNVTGAPDSTNVSGTTTANLQGTWANFTGAARIDKISVTETPQSGSPLTLTMTFEVAGTNSPAYSSQPTSSWPTVITPDKLSSGQATQAAGPYASIGEDDGSVQTSFSMPSYNPNTSPISLDYNSTTANSQPIFLTEYQLPFGQSVPSTITAQLTFDRSAALSVTYNTSGLNPGDTMQIALQANATALSTGRYPWSITVTNGGTPTTYSGSVDIVNQANSPYGAGWSLDNTEQLVSVSGGEILVNPDGTSLWYASNGSGGYTTPAGSFATLTYSSGVYTLTMPDGTKDNFNSSGQETSSVDRDNNTASFTYNSFGGVASITDMNNQVTTLTYNSSNLLTSITDPASRTATLSYTGKQLTSITDPGSDVWNYSYDSANDLTKLTDPNNNATTFAYNSADRVSSVTQPDSTTELLTPVQMNGWAAAGGSNITATLLATGDQAKFTDAGNNVWTAELDRLGFGEDIEDKDPLGDTSLSYINSNGLVWQSTDALGRTTFDFFDGNGNITKEVAPDGTTQQYQYNSFGEVTQYTDQEGHVTSYAYNSKGDLTQETDALGNVTSYSYNSAGLVNSTTDPNNNTTTYAYNSLNELTSTTNPLGGVTSYSYNSAGDLTRTIDPLSFTTTYDYNALGWMTSETLPDTPGVSSTYTFTYDKVGNQTSVTDPLNHTTSYSYNAVNEQTSSTNPLNQTTVYGYNAVGEQISVTDPLGDETTYGYDAVGDQVSMTDPMGDTTIYGYDAAGEQTSITDPVGNVTDYSYNAVGEVSSQSNPSGALAQQINYSYDPDGNLLSTATVNPDTPSGNIIVNNYTDSNISGSYTGTLGGSISGTFSSSFSGAVFNDTHQVIGDYTASLGGTITGTLNDSGSISGTEDGTVTVDFGDGLSGGGSFSFSNTDFSGTNSGGSGSISGVWPFAMSGTVDSSGDVSCAINSTLSLTFSGGGGVSGPLSGGSSGVTGEGTSYSYNAIGEQTSVTDALGGVTTYSYDADGNVTTVTDPDGNSTTTTYNGLNETVNVTNQTCGCPGMSGTTTYGYNSRGDETSMTDPSDNVTNYTYDGQGRMLTETAANGGVTSYAYDAAGNQTAETDSDGNTTTYGYNAANELTSTTEPQAPGDPAAYAYNAAGELTSATDPDGRTISYTYDKAGRETSQTWVGGSYTATYNYNGDGELTSASDPYSTYTYTYNALGEQTSVSNAGTPGVPTVTLNYGYDDFGNRTSLTDSLGGSISYAYNAGNEMTSLGLSVSGALNAQVTFAYDGAGNVTGMTQTAPSVSGSHTIAASYSYNHSNELTNISYIDTTAGVRLASYTYGYNTAGVLTSYQDNSGNSLTYGYDANDELTSATGTLAGSSYTFTYNYDHNGNRTSTTTDVNGTLTSATYSTTKNELTNDGTYSYTYDNNGNMLTQTNLQTSSVTTYTWDYENRLTEVRTATSDEKFTYDVFGNRIGVSLNGTQQLYTVCDGSNPYLDFNGSGTLTERYLTNPNGLNQFYGQVNGSGTTQWFVTDNLGSVRQIVSTGGTVLDVIVYDPYGSIISQTSATSAPRFLFTGGAYDAITGTYLDGAREDNPADGRWESPDPLGLQPDSNRW